MDATADEAPDALDEADDRLAAAVNGDCVGSDVADASEDVGDMAPLDAEPPEPETPLATLVGSAVGCAVRLAETVPELGDSEMIDLTTLTAE